MSDVLWFLLIVILLGGAVVGAAYFMRWRLPGSSLLTRFFPPDVEHRLEVVEQANVDGRRRLLLIRRDDVEHLIMTGGPVDVVIETGIKADAGGHEELSTSRGTFGRQPPPLSKVSSER